MPAELADGVGAGVERLLAGRAAVGRVVGFGVGDAVDLEVEGAGVGGRDQVLHDLELAGLAGVRDRADDVVAGRRPGRSAGRRRRSGWRDDLLVRVGRVDAADRLLVVGEVGRAGAGALADRVGAGVERLLAGRAAVADVAASGSVTPSIWRSKRPGSVGRDEVLLDLELAGLARVRDRADDVRRRSSTLTVAGRRRRPAGGDDLLVGVGGVDAADRLLVVVEVGRRCRRPRRPVGAGVEGLLAGRAAVGRRSSASGSVTPSIWRSKLPGSVVGLEVLLDLELAGLAGVRDRADDVRSPVVDRDGQRAGVVGGLVRRPPVRVGRVDADDRLLVVGEVGGAVPADLADRVGAGVERSSRRSCRRRPRRRRSGSVTPSIWRSKRPGSAVGIEVLLDLELAGLAGVRDRADDVVAGSRPERSAGRRRRRAGRRPPGWRWPCRCSRSTSGSRRGRCAGAGRPRRPCGGRC